MRPHDIANSFSEYTHLRARARARAGALARTRAHARTRARVRAHANFISHPSTIDLWGRCLTAMIEDYEEVKCKRLLPKSVVYWYLCLNQK